jgi:hypothetical protein
MIRVRVVDERRGRPVAAVVVGAMVAWRDGASDDDGFMRSAARIPGPWRRRRHATTRRRGRRDVIVVVVVFRIRRVPAMAALVVRGRRRRMEMWVPEVADGRHNGAASVLEKLARGSRVCTGVLAHGGGWTANVVAMVVLGWEVTGRLESVVGLVGRVCCCTSSGGVGRALLLRLFASEAFRDLFVPLEHVWVGWFGKGVFREDLRKGWRGLRVDDVKITEGVLKKGNVFIWT